MLKRGGGASATLLFVLFINHTVSAQTAQTPPVQMPSRFVMYFEQGLGDQITKMIKPDNLDSFDSEKKTRVFDGIRGQVTYQAELTDDEKRTILEAIQTNNLLAVKDDFTDKYFTCECKIDPFNMGKLRLDIDGRIKEIRFIELYSWIDSKDGEWKRLRNVLDVIEGILRTKDGKQDMPPHRVAPEEIRLQLAPTVLKIR